MSKSSRTVHFVRNMICTGLYQLTAMVMGFITPRLMILAYGSQVNGLLVSVTEFLTYFKMVEAGLAAAASVALYKPLAEGDAATASGIVSAARLFYQKAGMLFCGLTVAFALGYPLVVPVTELGGTPMGRASETALILAMGLSGALEFFTLSRYRVLLTADQKTDVVSLASMTSLLVSTALMVVLPFLGVSVIVVRLAASLTILLRSVILREYVKRKYPKVDGFATPAPKALGKRWDALCFEMTDVFQQGAGIILASLITRNAAILSVYGIYHMVAVGLWGILKMGTTGIHSIFGNLLVSRDRAAFQNAYRDFESLYQMVCTVLFGVAAVLIVPFVNLYTYGVQDVNYNLSALGLLVIGEAMSNHGKAPMDLMIPSSGAFREVRRHCVLQVATTIMAGVSLGVLGLRYGPVHAVCGVLVGVILGNLLRMGLQLSFVPKALTGLPWTDSLKRILRMFFTVGLIAAPCLALIKAPRRFYTWFMYGVLLMLYAGAATVFFAWLFDREALRSLMKRARHMLGG